MGPRASLDILETIKKKTLQDQNSRAPRPSHFTDCSIPVLFKTYAVQPHLQIKMDQAATLHTCNQYVPGLTNRRVFMVSLVPPGKYEGRTESHEQQFFVK